jgi:hypothetical protein
MALAGRARSRAGPSDGLSLEDNERSLLARALEKTNGNQTQAARLLRVTRDTLRYKMKKFNLRYGLRDGIRHQHVAGAAALCRQRDRYHQRSDRRLRNPAQERRGALKRGRGQVSGVPGLLPLQSRRQMPALPIGGNASALPPILCSAESVNLPTPACGRNPFCTAPDAAGYGRRGRWPRRASTSTRSFRGSIRSAKSWPADRGGQPREILSPAVARNAWASFHVVISAPPQTTYLLYVVTNPLNACRVALYKEHFEKTRRDGCPTGSPN